MHFISGLPRAGSTLLAAILRQNPRFHADMSSPLAAIYNGLLERMSAKNEYHLSISDAQRTSLCKSVFTSFYAHIPEETVVFDTSRVWCAKLPDIVSLFPGSKVVCWFGHYRGSWTALNGSRNRIPSIAPRHAISIPRGPSIAMWIYS